MATDPYTQTTDKDKGVDDALAKDINDLRAEAKLAAEGIPTHDLDIVIAYTGGSDNDLPETITATDNEADANLDISYVATITYDGSNRPTQTVFVFSVLGITLTEVYSYTADDITTIARTFT